MSDASSVRRSTTLPAATGRMASSIRYSNTELNLANGTQWVPLGRVVLTALTAEVPSNGTNVLFVADRDYYLIDVKRAFGTQSTGACNLQVVKATDATAITAGTDMLSTPMSLQGTADTQTAGGAVISTATGVAKVLAGQRIGIKTSAASTGLANAVVQITLRPA